jgi:hypothetical protein
MAGASGIDDVDDLLAVEGVDVFCRSLPARTN